MLNLILYFNKLNKEAATQAGLGSLQFSPQGDVTGVGAGTGVAAYQPYLQAAEDLAAPSAYQSYMSPYQTEVIDATQALLDEQRAKGLNTLRGSQYAQGAYGQGRGQIGEAEYLRGRDISDAGQIAALDNKGLTQAQSLQQQALKNQLGLGQAQTRIRDWNYRIIRSNGSRSSNIFSIYFGCNSTRKYFTRTISTTTFRNCCKYIWNSFKWHTFQALNNQL